MALSVAAPAGLAVGFDNTMRKVNPDAVRNGWSGELTAIVTYFSRTSAALSGSAHEMADRSHLAESTFLSAFVAFEGFCSDLFIAYLNQDFSQYQNRLETQIRASTVDKFGSWAEGRIEFKRLIHIPVDQLATAVDPEGKNLTFSTAEKMISKANEWLGPAYVGRISSLNAHDKRLYDTGKAIRNYIAHRSYSAKELMNNQLDTIDRGPPNWGLGRGANWVHYIGSFLKAWCDDRTRVEKYIARMQHLIGKM